MYLCEIFAFHTGVIFERKIVGGGIMAYTALYRKFRPLTFNEMVGQEAITRTLKNQIMAGRVGHAYLFSGGRGTGKTSSAKILARAINCLHPKDGEPCNECEICKGILAGSLTDVVEMDAASNNSVEDIRSIREEVNFLPTLAKYRVYIIDEVHMLSTGAFNALLKTLEEPPEHVKFILATTEPQKLPATILSRCQRFDFKRIPNHDIIKRLDIICKQSNIEITEEAMQMIAVLSEGAMRDAISILERCVQDGENEITEDKIKELVGIPKLTYIYGLTKAILEYNVEQAIGSMNDVLEEGKDLNHFLWETIKYLKDLLLLKTGAEIVLYSEQEKQQMKELAEKASKERLLKLIYALSDLDNSMKWSSQKNILFQVGIMKACSRQENEGIEEIEQRLNKIEEMLKQGITIPKMPQQNNIPPAKLAPSEPEKKKAETVKTQVAVEAGNYVPYWQTVINQLRENGKVMLYTNLINSKAKEINDMTIGIEFGNGLTAFGKTVLEKPENKQELIRLISIQAGKEMQIKYLEKGQEKTEEKKGVEKKLEGLDIPFHIIEE